MTDANTADQWADLRQLTNTAMTAAHLPGLSVVVIEGGQTVWQAAFGVRSVETKLPVTPDTIFEAASLSKPVAAFGAMKLVERGLLDLDKPLITYLAQPYAATRPVSPDDTAATVLDDPRLQILTARHVLSHSTGFPNWRGKGQTLKFSFDPGTRFGYSGEGFTSLGLVLESITSQPLSDYLQESVLNPLGMTDSSFTWREGYLENYAQGHDEQNQPIKKRMNDYAMAAGSLHTTATDYARFVLALLQGQQPAMLQPQIKLTDELGWGLGVGIQHTAHNGEIFWQWGNNPGYEAIVMFSVQEQRGLVAMTNGQTGQKVLPKLAKVVMGDDLPGYDVFLAEAHKFIIFG